MSTQRGFAQVQYTEDPLMEAALGRPTFHQHYAIHTREHDSLWTKMAATKDMLYDEHNDALGFAKYVLSGGLIFGSLATAFWVTHMEDTPSYTDRKITNYSRSQYFGHAQVFLKYTSKFVGLGAIAGGAWYLWWHVMWNDHNKNQNLFTFLTGYSLYLGAAAAFYHPRMIGYGLVLGLAMGATDYTLRNAQWNTDKSCIGFTYEIPGTKTSEERELQKQKDQITYLGYCHNIKFNTLKEL